MMSAGRLLDVMRLDLALHLRRPIIWIWLFLLALTAWMMSSGDMTISTGDTSVGGTRAWLTSEFAVSMVFSFLILILDAFFVSVVAGMVIHRDEELRVGEVLHATPLRAEEYVWGKALAALITFTVVLVLHIGLMAFFNHVVPNPAVAEVRGPFSIVNYLRPGFLFGLPTLIFMAGISFYLGERWRKPILVFLFPVVVLLACGFFLWTWSPSWLDPRINKLLMVLDVGGFRWINETWLKVDRGVDFYNQAPVVFDSIFIANRILYGVVGLGAIALAVRRFARALRGESAAGAGELAAATSGPGSAAPTAAAVIARKSPGAHGLIAAGAGAGGGLGGLGMTSRIPSYLGTVWEVARFELRELRGQPGLYLFAPIIFLQSIGNAMQAIGPFNTPILTTPGLYATNSLNSLSFMLCLLLMFYTVESLQRERGSGLAAIAYSTPMKTSALLFGKSIANTVVGIIVTLTLFVAGIIVILVQGKVQVDVGPFLIVWGLVLVPTLLLWTSFVIATYAFTGNRYTTYAIGLAAFIFTLYRQLSGQMNWVGNWFVWGPLPWSDLGPLELNGPALVWNRLFAVSLTILFIVLAVKLFARRENDPTGTLVRLRPLSLLRGLLGLAPFIVVPLGLGIVLYAQIDRGFQGSAAEKAGEDYRAKNFTTFWRCRLPDLQAVELDLELEPEERWFWSTGSYVLYNAGDDDLDWIPLTGGRHWDEVSWTLDGEAYEPEDRSGLFVFAPAGGLQPEESLRIGFTLEGRMPRGLTRNGGGAREFILPSGVVVTSFNPSVLPVLGFDEEIGVDEENRLESPEFADDFHVGPTRAGFGSDTPFTTRIRVTGPADYTFNSVGKLVQEEVADGRRTVLWESDHPVQFFNVVAGRWAVRRGEGTAIYYHPAHDCNIDEIGEALDAARHYYSEWFHPYPWRELKLSEFPALASYAMGMPTNITFSEGIGFLTRSDPRANVAFLVTAHETAHQWWGNLVLPGFGPGGNIVSEGMSHFSTILLFDQVKGARSRIEFCRRIEENYGDQRQVDSERPMVKIDGTRGGDETVTYDKGGWVMWMLLQCMGREQALEGLQAFVTQYTGQRDHPVLQDLVASLRPFAPDVVAFDAFVEQWFFDVVVPEYRLSDAERVRVTGNGGGDATGDGDAWEVSVEVENVGSGRMPLEIAATRGDRFSDDEEGSEVQPDYREARTSIVLGAGESETVTLRCEFEPESVLVDPDALVLQLMRENAIVRF